MEGVDAESGGRRSSASLWRGASPAGSPSCSSRVASVPPCDNLIHPKNRKETQTMKKAAKWIIPALTLLIAGGAVARVTLAEPDRGYRNAHQRRGGGGSGHPLGRSTKKLGLTDEQADKIADIMTEARKKTIKARANLRVAGIEMGELLTRDEVDKEKVNQKINRIGQATENLIRNRMDAFFRIREVLTPEQRKKAKPFIRRMFSRHAGGFSKKRGWGHRGRRL